MDKLKRAQGAMLAFICGDAIGGVTEMMEPKEIKKKHGRVSDTIGGGWLNLAPGEYTDDSAMMLAVSRSLVSTGGVPDYRDMADRLQAWLGTNPKDVGLACRRGLEAYRNTGRLRNGDDSSLGNGGLLRCLPFALAGRDWQEAMEHVALTHDTSLQARAVQSYVLMIQAGLAGGSKIDMLMMVKGGGNRRSGITNNRGDVRNTLSSACHWFCHTDSLEDCIVSAVNAGHDADSVAAIAGSLAGCHYGIDAIPERWVKALDPVVCQDARDLTQKLISMDKCNVIGGNYECF